jgi:hypothetical protein
MPKRRSDPDEEEYGGDGMGEADVDAIDDTDDVIDDPNDGLASRGERDADRDDDEYEDDDRDRENKEQSQSQDGPSNLFLRNAEQLFPDSFLSQSQSQSQSIEYDNDEEQDQNRDSNQDDEYERIGDDYEYPLSPGVASAIFEPAVVLAPVPEPKKPISAWILFSSRHREKMKADGIKLGFKESAAHIADAYKNLTTEEKAAYEAEAVADKERYLAEMVEVKINAYNLLSIVLYASLTLSYTISIKNIAWKRWPCNRWRISTSLTL